MKFSCEKNILGEAISKVIKIIPSKATIQAIEGILFHLYDDGILKLTGFDFTVGIETTISVDDAKPGSIIINAKMIFDILANIPSGTVYFESKDNKTVKIVCGNLDYTLVCLDGDIFPNIPIVENKSRLEIKQSVFSGMIRKTSATVMMSDINPVLKGIMLKTENNKLTMVSSDTYRLSICNYEGEYTNQTGEEIKNIIPGRALSELTKLFDSEEKDENVIITLSENHCAFETGSFRMVTSLIKGEFVNYSRVKPASFKTKVKIRREDLIAAVTRASLLLVNEKLTTPIRFSFEFDHVIISLYKENGQRYTDEVKIEIDGENYEIGFNNRHLLGILSCIDDEYIYLQTNSSLLPASITPIEGEEYYYLLSPMRLNNKK